MFEIANVVLFYNNVYVMRHVLCYDIPGGPLPLQWPWTIARQLVDSHRWSPQTTGNAIDWVILSRSLQTCQWFGQCAFNLRWRMIHDLHTSWAIERKHNLRCSRPENMFVIEWPLLATTGWQRWLSMYALSGTACFQPRTRYSFAWTMEGQCVPYMAIVPNTTVYAEEKGRLCF